MDRGGRTGRSVLVTALLLLATAWRSDRSPADRSSEVGPLMAAPTHLSTDPALRLRVRLQTVGQAHSAQDTRTAGPPASDLTRLASASQMIRQGRPRQALTVLAPPSALFPDRRAYLKGRAHEALGRHDDARHAFQQAIEVGQTPQLQTKAARALIKIYAELREPEGQLFYLDALLADPNIEHRTRLELERARVLEGAGRRDEATRAAFAILTGDSHPTAARGALELLERVAAHPEDDDAHASEASRAFLSVLGLVERSPRNRAAREVARFRKAHQGQPEGQALAAVLEAELAIRQRRHADGLTILKGLRLDLLPDHESERALLNRVRLAVRVRAFEEAESARAELRRRAPRSPFLPDADLTLARARLKAKDYAKAAATFWEHAEDHAGLRSGLEARWMSGFSSLLSNDLVAARRAFEALKVEAHDANTIARAGYWMGRVDEEGGHSDEAIHQYREIRRSAPLTDLGLWAESRLRAMEARPDPRPSPSTEVNAIPTQLAHTLSRLGDERPLALDRALALAEAGRWMDAAHNLGLAASILPIPEHPSSADDLARSFDAHDHGFEMARLANRRPDIVHQLVAGDPSPWRALHPRPHLALVESESRRRGINPLLVFAVMRSESRFRAEAESNKGAQGLMQLLPATAQSLVGDEFAAPDLSDPETNLRLGIAYLGRLVDRYRGHVVPALAAYNAGPGVVDQWLERMEGLEMDAFVELIPFAETRSYVKRTLSTYRLYGCLYAPELPTLAIERAKAPTITVARRGH